MAIEGLASGDQLLLVVPQNEVALTRTRPDGLLQRRISLEVLSVFVGTLPVAPSVHADEIVWRPSDFMSREPTQRVVRLHDCLEEDGQKRLVVVEAHSPTESEVSELMEDVERYTPQTSEANDCYVGTESAMEKFSHELEADGA